MLLYELTKPKELSQVQNIKMRDGERADYDGHRGNWADITDYFKARGFKKVGSGAKATVYEHPSYPYVIKFFYKDSAYSNWLKFCLANQNNAYIPKIKGRPTRVSKTDFYFVRLERLYPLYHINKDFNVMRAYIDVTETFAENPREGLELLEAEKERIENYNDLLEVFQFLKRYPGYLDLHMGNSMTRPNGEFVIIDPLYSSRDSRFFD